MCDNRVFEKRAVILTFLLICHDIFAANLAYGLALWLRFDLHFSMIPEELLRGWFFFTPIFAVLVLAVCSSLKLYGSIWEYASYIEVIRGYIACFVLGVLQVIGTILLTTRMPISYYLIGWLLMFILLVGIRMSYRGIRFMKIFQRQNDASLERVLIVGMSNIIRVT